MSDKYPTSHLPVEKIDELRFKAFRSNAPDDVLAYYKAASLYFQDHYVREMNHEIDRDAAYAAGYKAALQTKGGA